ncbi:Aste57867_1362 [Aphanomyces stellatus]|uniref:Aste57867_1362 protein n=1 Tax=Aphanomyces stellatus TaxID=120398 RepID=A0A485K6A0_9STRA|nr:hypothetical protein As57867_001361 [Aphanomyces stellatus]VFT78581.1 Aste57867_1362 [Aphanomyces stellatus]
MRRSPLSSSSSTPPPISIHAAPPALRVQVHDQSFYFEPSPHGITIGADATSHLRFVHDLGVDHHHATLEQTPLRGIWVFVDHSIHGTYVNFHERLHADARVVRDGDRFTIGTTSFSVHFHSSRHQQVIVSPTPSSAPTAFLSPTRVPKSTMLVPAYTNSPVPKHKSSSAHNKSAPSKFSFDSTTDDAARAASPAAPPPPAIPLEYSASPPVSSGMHYPPHAATTERSSPPTFANKPSKRDDLRIHVSKKMANLIPKPTAPPPHPLPMSPVPQAALRHQQHQLQLQVTKKTNEAAWLHQQQRDYLQGYHSTTTTTRKSFTLEIPSPPPPHASARGAAARHELDRVDVLSSVSSGAPTEIAHFRESMESLLSDDEDDDERDDVRCVPSSVAAAAAGSFLDVAHLRRSFDTLLNKPLHRRPNPPPPEPDDDPRFVRLKQRVKTAPILPHHISALHSPYKSAKHRAHHRSSHDDEKSFFREAAPSPTHFDYTV